MISIGAHVITSIDTNCVGLPSRKRLDTFGIQPTIHVLVLTTVVISQSGGQCKIVGRRPIVGPVLLLTIRLLIINDSNPCNVVSWKSGLLPDDAPK